MGLQMASALDLIDLRAVAGGVRARWKLYLIALVVAFAATGLVLPVLDKGFKAEATLQLREEQKTPQLSSILSSLSSSDGYNSLEAVLSSRLLASRLAQKPEIIRGLGLDRPRSEWLRDITDMVETGLFRLEPAGRGDNVDAILSLLSKRLKLSRAASSSNVVTVEFAFAEKDVARLVLGTLLAEADIVLRDLNMASLDRRLAHISNMMAQDNVESTRKSLGLLYDRLETELIGARSLSPYAYTIIDAPAVTNVRARPAFWLVFAGLFALFAAFITASIVFTLRGRD